MPNDYQYRGFVKHYPHLQRKDLSYEERMKLYYETKENAMCGCGRSPREDGKCVGFHKLTEAEWTEKKELLIETYQKLQAEQNG
jgi:CDGSH-type Zn-finger protein